MSNTEKTTAVSKAATTTPGAPLSDAKLKQWLKDTGKTANMNDADVSLFLEIAKASGLNPFKREIHASKYSKDGELAIITGYEVYIDRANASELLNGWKVETSGKVADNTLKATLTIYRKDWSEPFIWDAYYVENVGRKRDGSVSKFWKTRPAFMLKKVCISQGFRLCFTEALGGLPYTREEMETGDDAYRVETQDVEVQEVNPEPKAQQKPKAAPKTIDVSPKTEDKPQGPPEADFTQDPDYQATEEQILQLKALIKSPYFDGVNNNGVVMRDAIVSKMSEGLDRMTAEKWIKSMTKKVEDYELALASQNSAEGDVF